MKIKKTVPLSGLRLIDYYADDFTVIMLGASQKHVDLMSIDPDTLGLISSFPVAIDLVNQSSICFDDSCVYLPSKMGQILALDKFSGQILATMNIALPIVSDLANDDKNVYCVCGVPISKKWKFLIDNFSLCIFDKETGQNKVQSNYFAGAPSFLKVTQDHVWVLAGDYLYQYAKDGELLNQAHLGVSMDYPPIVTEDHVILVSANGIVRVLNAKDLSFFTIIRAVGSEFCPILTNNQLIWFTKDGICQVEYIEQVFKENKLNRTMNSMAVPVGNKIVGCDISGGVVTFDLGSSEISAIKVSKQPLRKLIRIENHLFVASSTQLYRIEIEE